MEKTVYIIEENEKDITSHLDEIRHKDIIFRKLKRDTIGKSMSMPTWGFSYSMEGGKMHFKGEALYKSYNYDEPNAAYSEKIASIMGRNLLDNIRVPEIDIVEEDCREPAIMSYKVLDNDAEDMFHIRDIMFHKFERDELSSQKDIFDLKDILECVKKQITDEENYEEVEKNIIRTLLFDAISNNGDRHGNNWALVRNKETNYYELATFDHASCYTDMIKEQKHFTVEGWVSSYTSVRERQIGTRKGSLGKDIISYIAKNYNEYFNEFCEDFDKRLPNILEEIKQENLPIDIRRLEKVLNERNRFLQKIRSREDLSYGRE